MARRRQQYRERRSSRSQGFSEIQTPIWDGLNEDENPASLGERELSVSLNCSRWGRLFGTRPGFSYESGDGDYSAALSPTVTDIQVQGIVDFSTGNDFARDSLVVVADGFAWTDDSTKKGAGTSQITAGRNPATFEIHRDKLYIAANSGANGDTFSYWDGAAANLVAITGIVDGVPNAIDAPRFVLHWRGTMFIAGMRPEDRLTPGTNDPSNNPMVVRFHDIGTDPTVGTNWRPEDTIGAAASVGSYGGLSDYGDEFITGLATYRGNDGEWLLILTNRKISTVVQVNNDGSYIVDSAIANGCVHQNAFVSLGLDSGEAVYLSDRGVHSLRQSQQNGSKEHTFLSWKIRKTFDTINKEYIDTAVGGYDPTEGLILFAVPTGTTTNELILCLDVKDQPELNAQTARWTTWRLGGGETISSMETVRDENNQPRLYIGTNTGMIGFMQRTTYNDFGVGYAVRWIGKHRDFGTPMTKVLGDFSGAVHPGGDYDPTVRHLFDYGAISSSAQQVPMAAADNGEWDSMTWDSDNWGSDLGTSNFWHMYGEGEGVTIAHEFSHTSANEPFFISSLSEQVDAGSEFEGEAA